MQDWIARLFEDRELQRMGHYQRKEDLNLGLGWLYYSLGRIVRPRRVVVIGSWRGFVPLMFGRALLDNGEGGEVTFIDPSLADDFWKDARKVRGYFAGHGLDNVRHHLMTTQEFVQSEPYRALGEVGIVFVDGFHSEEQARIDHEAFEPLLAANGIVLFHDSVSLRRSTRYGKDNAYTCTVRHYLDKLKQRGDLQVYDLPFGEGVSLVARSVDQETLVPWKTGI